MDVKVNFVYQPVNLYDLKGDIQLQSNCWSQPRTIECSLEVKRPIFQSNPHAIIEWGKIENGRITRRLLTIKNNGAKVLRLDVDSVKLKQNFIKVASINRPTGSINYPIEIIPNAEDPFHISIECESLESTAQTFSPIELAEFNLISLRDPIMSIDGQFKERTITILLSGHLSDADLPKQLNQKVLKEWKDLRIIPSSWIKHVIINRTIFEPYSLLITMVGAAYAAHSNQITILPHNIEDYKSLLNPIHGKSDTLINPLTLDDISNDPSSTIVDLLYKYFRTIVDHQEFFRYSTQFHQSFNNIDVSSAIRLQLYATINSTSNNDEAYTMQLYVTTILTRYFVKKLLSYNSINDVLI